MSGIPWLQLIRFHHEVAKRAEKGFFSFYPHDENGDRWSSLDFPIRDQLAGPWRVKPTDIRSQPFRQSLQANQFETVFIGGPCYAGSERGQDKKWYDRWQPILYREVEIQTEGDEWLIVPRAGAWAVSPLLIEAILRKAALPVSEVDALASRLVEKAQYYSEDSEPVRSALLAIAPEATETLDRQQSPRRGVRPPTPWVLFAPTRSFSPLTRYLINDYEELEKRLEQSPEDIGGLRVLEGEPWQPIGDEVDIMPLVPLNDSQRRAVQAMLKGDPLTVVSGPPGCGKSQVVVSLLLNAWAKGMSVLFASNNNKAVDVVRERLERFERQVPIAVRAGNVQMNRVGETLRNVTNAAIMQKGVAFGIDPEAAKRQRDGKVSRKAQLQVALDGRLPQRTDESLKAALRLYGESQAVLAQIESMDADFSNRLRSLGMDGWSPSRCQNALERTQAWIDQLAQVRALAASDECRYAETVAAASERRHQRDRVVEQVGLDPTSVVDWNWVLAGPIALEQWSQNVASMLERPLERELVEPEWHIDYDRWTSEESAVSWSQKADALAVGIRQSTGEVKTKRLELERRINALESARRNLREQGIPDDVSINEDLLSGWLEAFAKYMALKQSWTDFLPWSRRRTLARRLVAIEAELYRSFPLSMWLAIGHLNDATRRQLGERFEICRNWLHHHAGTPAIESQRAEINQAIQSLRSDVGDLAADLVPSSDEPVEWLRVAERLSLLSRTAITASAAWAARARAKASRDDLTRQFTTWTTTYANIPIVAGWRKVEGKEIHTLFSRVSGTPESSLIEPLRQIFHGGGIHRLFTAWREASSTEHSARGLDSQAKSTLRESSHRNSWLGTAPPDVLVNVSDRNTWPDEGFLRKSTEEPRNLILNWRGYAEQEKPRMTSNAERLRDQAFQKLDVALTLLKTCADAAPADTVVSGIRRTGQWPQEELLAAFRAVDPNLLKAEIEGIDRELEIGSFSDAKVRWMDRVRSDVGAQKAIGTLKDVFDRSRGRIGPEHAGTFRSALALVPIWISTAQATQAIPLDAELFDLVVIDEASQCTLTNLLPLLYRGKRLVVIGDSEQLPAIPTIRSNEEELLASQHDLATWVVQYGHANNDVYKVASRVHPQGQFGVVMLTDHYRSHPQIIGFANKHIYHKALSLKREVAGGSAAGVLMRQASGRAIRSSDGSWKNPVEAQEVVAIVRSLRRQGGGGIGVVTPFRAQKEAITEMLAGEQLLTDVQVGTAHEFQGDERDVVIFSPVVAPGIPELTAKWVEDPANLVNVALTRAKDALYVVADFSFLKGQKGILKNLAKYCEDIDLLRRTSESELLLFSWLVMEGLEPRVHSMIGDIEVDLVLEGKGIRVAVEVGAHPLQPQADAARDAMLGAQGYRVVRLTGTQILGEPFQCVEEVKKALSVDGLAFRVGTSGLIAGS